ncbi:crotonase/enoyl-CoA hydratase family protein [Gymnodinialimonas ceratoperidinii]|uniref:Crotonase/enoyl-CoA hydratase family protein n=1 Tax=Gymnodinialimonas ceratoperidinii TaxID=2856823 RepID=A0A8F6TWH1_9RHOB|nr:crotonase/enoyl-CoA hydratase family protein [Gymnodinialimonas ceratoperidinii]QXT39194.1 crotonase/enoyl-CoA hydratase family protein [Gymnodinialimonas ceratoperidinii]
METVHINVDERGVAVLRLNRPDVHNAMNAAMIAELTQAAERLGRDPAVRVVVLTGTGPSFCAGGDLGWMQDQMAADAPTRAREARALAEMLGALDRLSKPLIGRIQGQSFGGGIGLMSVCDVAISVEGAKFGLTEVRLGLIPATIGPYVVARMGAARARRVFFSGRRFSAAEAVDLGLLARVVPAEELDAAIEAEVKPYLSAAPGAVAEGKALVATLGGQVSDGAITATIDALVSRWESQEAREGIEAFFDKRKPRWSEG